MNIQKVRKFNFKVLLTKAFGTDEWWGPEGGGSSAFVRRLGNWVYVHSDARVEQERKKLRNE